MTTDQKAYTSSRTLTQFHNDPNFVRVVVGPLGSGKSTAMILELALRAHQETPSVRGTRITRFAIVRNTLQQLRQTVLPDVHKWLGPAFEWRESKATGYLSYKLPDGTSVQSEWLFIPLDTPQDTRRLLSNNFTGAWISEVREVPYDVFFHIQGRIGRFWPNNRPPRWQGLICESNPWSEGSPYHENLVLKCPKGWKLFNQPGGLDPLAENIENLPEGYYQRLIEGNTEDWINVHVHAQWGEDMSGMSVFGRIFDRNRHVVDNLQVIPGRPLMVTQDFGRTPTALINQIDPKGRLVTLEEVMADNMGLEEFVRTKLVPVLKGPRFANSKVYVIGDPTGQHKSSVNEDSCFDVLRRARLITVAAPTNDVEPRLRAVENLMLRNVGKEPAILIDGAHCPNLVRALGHSYRYKRRKSGELDPLPEKSHPWSDLADCYQYAACSIDGSAESRALSWERALTNRPTTPKFSPRAWT